MRGFADRISAKRYSGGLILAAFVGLTLRSWALAWGLYGANVSRRPHPDEWVLYWLFHWFGGPAKFSPCPRTSHICFFDWGAAFPYAAYLVGGIVSPLVDLAPRGSFGPGVDMTYVQATLAGRATSVLFSTGTIFLAYLLGKRAYGALVGLAGALCVALSPLLVQLAHFATPDSASNFLVAATLLACLSIADAPSTRGFITAGVLTGAAIGTEYHMVLLSLPVFMVWAKSPGRDARWLVTFAVCAAACFALLNPYLLLDSSAFVSSIEHTLRIRTVDSATEYGDRWTRFGPAWLYVVHYALGYGAGALLSLWFVAGAVWAAIRHRRADILFLSWTVPYFLLVTVSPARFMRYSAPLFVILALFAARFCWDLTSRLSHGGKALIALLALATVVYTFAYDAAYVGVLAAPDPRTVAADWLAGHTSAGDRIAFEELPNGLVNTPYYVLSGDLRPCITQFKTARLDSADYLLLDSFDLEEHPRVQSETVERFRQGVSADANLTLVKHIDRTPTFLGLRFPIDGSPHDWRYPAHTIDIYHSSARPTHILYCFRDLAAATRALYVPTAVGGEAK